MEMIDKIMCAVWGTAVTLLVGLLIAFASLHPTTPAKAQARGEPVFCDQVGIVRPTTNTTTKVVSAAGTGSARILICGYYIMGNGGTAQLEYGTQATTPCDTGANTISASYATTVVGSDNSSNWRGLAAPNGNMVCLVTGTGAGAGSIGIVYYTYGY